MVNAMTAVAERTAEKNRTVGTVRTTRQRRVRRARPRGMNMPLVLGITLFMLVLFTYGAFNAHILVEQRRCSQIREETKKINTRNEQLSAQLETEKSPDRIATVASKAGMIRAKEYDYIGGVGRVASSAQ